MEIAEILSRIEHLTGEIDQEAIDAAIERRDEIVPELLGVLEKTIERAAEFDADSDYIAHLYAMFLLAQFREVRAYPLALRLGSLPDELPSVLLGDVVTDGFGAVLASVCGGDLTGIKSLVEGDEICIWVRDAALNSLVTLVAAGRVSREEVIAYFAELLRGKLRREEYSEVLSQLVDYCCDLYPAELKADIRRAFDEDLIDPDWVSWEDVENVLALGKESALANLAENPSYRLVEDAVAEMELWACFEEPELADSLVEEVSGHLAEPDLPALDDAEFFPETFRREAPKVGRNDPCPCGSGKKYKKCCGK
jgi:hypothetical protein